VGEVQGKIEILRKTEIEKAQYLKEYRWGIQGRGLLGKKGKLCVSNCEDAY